LAVDAEDDELDEEEDDDR
jgi:hypothetical protein